ncbi:efflux RND transporter periplasmic adaptor subunit [Opitutaceae bacterium EW11]|nr:efflux RND transporter periplasmic adaptor subunit [Opitutaceae bacterium EW11]
MAKSGNSRGVLVFLAIVVLAGAAGGYFWWKNRNEKPPEISTATVSRGDVIQAVTATGDLQPVTSVDVSSQISGLIQKLAVDYNSPVVEGQVLAQIDPASYEQRLKQAKADLASTQANATLVRLNTERTRDLRAKNLVSQQELDQAEAQLAQANAQLMTKQAAVEDAVVNLDRCTIKAPISGIVLSRDAEVGKTVAASLNAPTLFTIVNDLTKMQIVAAVAEADIGNVELDQVANFTVDAFPGRQFRGRVSQIRNSPKTTQNVVTYETIIDVHNDDQKLKPGMTANVSIVVAQRSGVLRLPNAALRTRIPDAASKYVVQPPAVAGAAPEAGAPAKPMSEEDRRKAMREIAREVGMTRGTPPTPDQLKQMQELAQKRGIEIDFSRWGNREGGGGRSNAGPSAAPVTRTVYKLVSSDPKAPKLQPISAKLGISDGVVTQVLDGLQEGDVLVTSLSIAGSASSPAANPFSGRSPFGPGGPRR